MIVCIDREDVLNYSLCHLDDSASLRFADTLVCEPIGDSFGFCLKRMMLGVALAFFSSG